MEDDFTPPYPLFSGRAPQAMTQVVIGYFGVQARAAPDRLHKAFAATNALFVLPDGPGHRDTVKYLDAAGYETAITAAYWGDPQQFNRWLESPEVSRWWASDDRLEDGVGYFREVMSPRDVQYETAYVSASHLEGLGVVMGNASGEILEHGYWGSMRDRIPLSQTDAMAPAGSPLTASPSRNRSASATGAPSPISSAGQSPTRPTSRSSARS